MSLTTLVRWFSWCAVFAGLLGFVACGGKNGTLSIVIVTSPTDDPFKDAASARFTIGDASHQKTVEVTDGKFTYDNKQSPVKMNGPITVEALDAQGTVIARGISPTIPLGASDAQVAIWVGRLGKVQRAAAQVGVNQAATDGSTMFVPEGRAEMGAGNVVGMGVLFAGGRRADGTATAHSFVYDVYTHTTIAAADMQKARAAPVVAPLTNVQAAVYGGATSTGLGTFAAPEGSIELFDPSVNIGLWATLPTDVFTARSYADGTLLLSGATLISGGIDGNGVAQASAAWVLPSGTIKLGALASPMAAARVGHAVAPARFPDGDGALIFGGLGGGTGPVAERLYNQNFAAYDLGAQDNRDYATATRLPDGQILILGGKTKNGVERSGLLVVIGADGLATVTALPTILSVARAAHTATLDGNELLVCGGIDGGNVRQPSCDIIDAKAFTLARTVPLSDARSGHSAGLLDNGVVVLAGGIGSDGKPLSSIELYTPP
jgi:hypothetical protein